MSSLVLRKNLSQPLSIAQADQNLTNLNNDKTESNTAVSVDDEMALFSGTTGKRFKRATTTGLAKLSAGVVSAATAADIVATIGATAVQKATTAANGGVTSVTVNGTTYTGAVTVSTTWASITGKPTGPNIAGTWTWSDPGGQPTYLWGSSNGDQMNPYSIAGLSVNYAASAGYANSAGYAGVLGAITHGAVGSLCFAKTQFYGASVTLAPGDTIAGSYLSPCGVATSTINTSGTLSGTWRCLGYAPNLNATLFQRIS